MNTIEAENMAIRLMDHHGLIEKGWTFVWMKMKQTFGQCWYSKKQILLSWPLTSLNDETTVRDTILHEIAHALAGRQHGHDRYWKEIAESIGAKSERCYNPATVNTPTPRWMFICNHCNHQTPETKTTATSVRQVLPPIQ